VITGLQIKNFKCFKELRVSLSNLNLLTGFNASGKSTLVQSLLLLAQTLRTKQETASVQINGPLVNLGTPGDVLHQGDLASEVEVGISEGNSRLNWVMKPSRSEEKRCLRVYKVALDDDGRSSEEIDPPSLPNLMPHVLETASSTELIGGLKLLVYLSAAREVQTDTFPTPNDPDPIHADVGAFGQFAPWWFHYFDDTEIEKQKCLETVTARTLRAQVNAWLGDLFPGSEANSQAIPNTQLVRLELRTKSTDEWRRPSNTGYGIGYAFPILVACLLAKKDQIVVIDSPEAHLHPKGQSQMGRFLARMAASGLQLIIETHSDHLLNGLRVALREQIVDPAQVCIYFFSQTQGINAVSSIRVDRNGNLSDWPKGFFDQAERDLSNLAGWS
jgi:predicted ATPase